MTKSYRLCYPIYAPIGEYIFIIYKMINEKYYNDIKEFPAEFRKGFELAKSVTVEGKFTRALLCGMGGSALYVDLINDYLNSDPTIKFRLEVQRGYDLPNNVDENVLFLITSHSGNTEETLSCLEQVNQKGYKYCIVTSGGKLLEEAKAASSPLLKIPGGIQPRLSTGYFIAEILTLLCNVGLIPDKKAEVIAIADKILVDEDHAKDLANDLVDVLPIIYATENNKSIATIAKIKFNENAKVQAFANYFPELNHNEMVGYTKLVTKPYFIILKSNFANSRNFQRIEVFTKLMAEKGLESTIIEMQGASVLEEILNAYYFIDFVTYYLAEKYQVDPEKVDMVENFKALLN
jgi:glucose/mannose-6-phosphate isomerase